MRELAVDRKPIVELLADRGPVPREPLVRLLVALRRTCVVRAADPRLTAAARLATSVRAGRLARVLDDPQVPVAVWIGADVDSPEALETRYPEVARKARVLLTDDEDRADALGGRGLAVPPRALDASAHPPITPFVRSRWRRRLGLPERMTVRLGYPDATPIGDTLVPTALAVTAAAAVRGPWLPAACALGTPVVTDAPSADSIGATPGRDVVACEPGELDTALDALCTDDERAASLSRAARRFVERRLDLVTIARTLLERLGIERAAPSVPASPAATLGARLDELGTPLTSALGRRAMARGAPLTRGS